MSNVMANFGKIVSYAFNSLDMSSAANDVVVVRHQDSTLHSSPFNVRFGKVKVLNPGDKVVMIEVNGTLTSAVMKMGADGVAYWLRPTTDVTDRPESPLESPNRGAVQSAENPPAFSLEGASSTAAKSPPGSSSPGISSPRSPPLLAVDDGSGSGVGSPTLPPLAPVAVEVVDFASMTGKEKAKFGELYESFAQSEAMALTAEPGAPAAGGSAGGSHPPPTSITLSKFASYDDLAIGASGAEEWHSNFRSGGGGGGAASGPISLSIAAAGVPAAGREADDAAAAGGDYEEEDDEIEDALGEDEDDDDDALLAGSQQQQHGSSGGNGIPSRVFFKQTLTPMHTDLLKLGLKEGMNIVKYITPTTLRGRVVVEARIFLYTSADKIVISDIDGTVTKSDVWGHLLPLIGRDWTHPGICSLYSKIAQNGYQILYLTARSVSQVEQTRQFLWGIEQGGVRLPKGPVFTAPDRFFTALTQEVTKKAHEFKIACLQSILQAFPLHSKPFYAGFGNRIGDVISYTATGIPKHKIFIIDTNSVLHVCHVKHSYKDLAHLVDHTFPPLAVRPRSSVEQQQLQQQSLSPLDSGDLGAVGRSTSAMNTSNGGLREGESVDQDYNNFNYWRIPPEQLISKQRSPPPSPVPFAQGVAQGQAVAAGPADAGAVDSTAGDGVAPGGPQRQDPATVAAVDEKKPKAGIWSKLWKSSQ